MQQRARYSDALMQVLKGILPRAPHSPPLLVKLLTVTNEIVCMHERQI